MQQKISAGERETAEALARLEDANAKIESLEQSLTAGSETAAAEAEGRVRELEERLAAAELSAEEGRLRVEATERLTERVAELERELQDANARAESASSLAGDGSGDGAATAHQRIAELENEVRQAEQRVDETDMRARRAYAAAEYAEAQLEAARERGEVIVRETTTPEMQRELERLRAELARVKGSAVEAPEALGQPSDQNAFG
jgi:chromosome segregation ATPase